MESMVKNNLDFWAGKRVLITGHTGFKGSWLMIWLSKLGAQIYGFSLEPDKNSKLFKYIFQSNYLTDNKVNHYIGDIRDKTELSKFVKESNPDVVFHLAAQPLVKKGYEDAEEGEGHNRKRGPNKRASAVDGRLDDDHAQDAED